MVAGMEPNSKVYEVRKIYDLIKELSQFNLEYKIDKLWTISL